MNVNLKCVYGDKHPKDNPHEMSDALAEKLIIEGLAEESDKQKTTKENSNIKVEELTAKLTEATAKVEENETLKAEVAELTAKLTEATAKVEEVAGEAVATIEDLKKLVIETSKLPVNKFPAGFKKYQE